MIRTPLRPLAQILQARNAGQNPDAIERENIRLRHEEMRDKARQRAEGRRHRVPDLLDMVDVELERFGEGDLEVTVKESSLSIVGKKADADKNAPKYLHRGIANRAFERRFDLADHIQVVAARLENGLLSVDQNRHLGSR